MIPASSSNFLVPNATLIVEIVAFLIVLYVIGRKVLPIVSAQIEERQNLIRDSLDQAESARTEAEETRRQRQGILEDARQQARDIVTQANRAAEQIRSDAQVRGQQEYERIVASAEQDIALARRRAVEDVSNRVGELVMATARQVVEREIDAERHRDLVDEAIAALRAGSDGSALEGVGSPAPA